MSDSEQGGGSMKLREPPPSLALFLQVRIFVRFLSIRFRSPTVVIINYENLRFLCMSGLRPGSSSADGRPPYGQLQHQPSFEDPCR